MEVELGKIKVKEMHRKRVKAISNVGHVYLPKDWIGKEVVVILLDEDDDDI